MKSVRIFLVVTIVLGLFVNCNRVEAAAVTEQDTSLVEVGKNIQVSKDLPDLPHTEPHLAINPIDSNNLIAVTILIDETSEWTCAVLTSFDGGETWSRNNPKSQKFYVNCGDPWIAFGPNGIAYMSIMAPDSQGIETTTVSRSLDGGLTWSTPVLVPVGKDEGGSHVDHPSIVVDNTKGSFSGYVYTISTQAFKPKEEETKYHYHPIILNRSYDEGKTFSSPIKTMPTNLVHQAGMPVILSDGTVVFTLYDYAPWNHVRLNKHRRIWAVSSSDGGQSVSIPAYVAEISDGNQFPTLVVDSSPSSPFQDRLYTVWTGYAPSPKGIFLAYSTDRGRTWSDPIQVSDEILDDNILEQRIPAITVNSKGMVGVAWYDSRRGTSNSCFDIFFAVSLDGGESFLPNVRISDTQSCVDPNVPGNIIQDFNVAKFWPTGGHYFGLVSNAEGVFHSLWSDSRTGVYQLWTTTIKINANLKTK